MYRHLDQLLEKGDVEVIGGMTGATPGCEPTLFNLFVFVGGRFAGTVSPTRMMPSRDGAAGAVRIISDDTDDRRVRQIHGTAIPIAVRHRG